MRRNAGVRRRPLPLAPRRLVREHAAMCDGPRVQRTALSLARRRGVFGRQPVRHGHGVRSHGLVPPPFGSPLHGLHRLQRRAPLRARALPGFPRCSLRQRRRLHARLRVRSRHLPRGQRHFLFGLQRLCHGAHLHGVGVPSRPWHPLHAHRRLRTDARLRRWALPWWSPRCLQCDTLLHDGPCVRCRAMSRATPRHLRYGGRLCGRAHLPEPALPRCARRTLP